MPTCLSTRFWGLYAVTVTVSLKPRGSLSEFQGLGVAQGASDSDAANEAPVELCRQVTAGLFNAQEENVTRRASGFVRVAA